MPDIPGDRELLLRRRRIQYVSADVFVRLLPAARDVVAGGDEAGLHALSSGYDGDFAAAAADRKGDFRGDYAQAAQVVDLTCGPGFVQPGVASNMGAKTGGNSMMGLVALAAILLNTIL